MSSRKSTPTLPFSFRPKMGPNTKFQKMPIISDKSLFFHLMLILFPITAHPECTFYTAFFFPSLLPFIFCLYPSLIFFPPYLISLIFSSLMFLADVTSFLSFHAGYNLPFFLSSVQPFISICFSLSHDFAHYINGGKKKILITKTPEEKSVLNFSFFLLHSFFP